MKLNEIAKILGGELRGDPEIEIKEILPVDEAKSGSLLSLRNPRSGLNTFQKST